MFTSRQIDVFRAVMSAGSVTSAAQRLHLSQPSVSRLLRELEDQFGCPLFVRQSKGVMPTPEAELFLEEVERIYGALATLEDVAREISRGQRGVLTLGTIASFAFEVAPRALVRLGVQDNEIGVTWRVRSSRQLLDWVRAGTLRLGLAYVEGELSGVQVILQQSLPHMCLLPAEHAHAIAGRALHLSDLAQERLISLVGATADTVRARRIGLREQSPIVAELSFAAAALAEKGGGVAIVDPFTAHAIVKSGTTAALPIVDVPPYDFALFEPIGTRASGLCGHLQELLAEEIDTIGADTKQLL